ncbi:hypothetical protein [Paenarthrobacter sp. YIM B13468]|uniref:hypothetical protein n=1 Tax=Paenarthrobacter sp. YIM B13468 TaxID=3366295 RepID=UPI00366DC0F1
MTAESPDTLREGIHWGWVTTSFLSGIGVTLTAFFVHEWWGWNTVAEAVLVNIGTALGITSVLFLLEKKFRVSIRSTAVEAAGQLVEQATRNLNRQMTDLESRIYASVEAFAREQDDVLKNLADGVTYESTLRALETANSIKALVGGTIIIRSSEESGMSVAFALTDDTDPLRRLKLSVLDRLHSQKNFQRRTLAREYWDPSESFEDAAARLSKAVVAEGKWSGPATLQWSTVLQNLPIALDLAIRSRRGDAAGTKLRGRILEVIAQDLFITEYGLEAPQRGLELRNPIVSESKYKPKWVSSSEWEAAADAHWTSLF